MIEFDDACVDCHRPFEDGDSVIDFGFAMAHLTCFKEMMLRALELKEDKHEPNVR